MENAFENVVYKNYPFGSDAHFTSYFSIVIQIWGKFDLSITPLHGIILLQKFAHTMTPQLLCQVQNFRMKFPSDFIHTEKVICEMDLWPQYDTLCHTNIIPCMVLAYTK